MRYLSKQILSVIMASIMLVSTIGISFAEEVKVPASAIKAFETNHNNENISFYEVSEKETRIITNGKVESVIFVSENYISPYTKIMKFLVNGEPTSIEVTTEINSGTGGFLYNDGTGIVPYHVNFLNPVEIDYHSGPWGSATTHTHNVKFEKAVGILGLGVVASLLASAFSLGTVGGITMAIAIALVDYNYGNSDASRTVWTVNYHQTLPTFYVKAVIQHQAGYKGTYTIIGRETAYFTKGGTGV